MYPRVTSSRIPGEEDQVGPCEQLGALSLFNPSSMPLAFILSQDQTHTALLFKRLLFIFLPVVSDSIFSESHLTIHMCKTRGLSMKCDANLPHHPIIPIPFTFLNQFFHPQLVCQHTLPLVCQISHELFFTHLCPWWPPPLHPCIPYLRCGHLYVARATLACHQLTCFTHRQLSIIGVIMLLALLNSHLSSIYEFHPWISLMLSITIPFIPSYSICFPCQCSTCFMHSFSSYDHQPI